MNATSYLRTGCDVAWCPGCGNYGILKIVNGVFAELEIDPRQTVLVSGIGQAAKLPQYLDINYFNGLHGREHACVTPLLWHILTVETVLIPADKLSRMASDHLPFFCSDQPAGHFCRTPGW